VFDHVAALDKPTPQWEGPRETSPVYKLIKQVRGSAGAVHGAFRDTHFPPIPCCAAYRPSRASSRGITRAHQRSISAEPPARCVRANACPHSPSRCSKYLIGRDGVPLRRYSPADPLDQRMEEDIVLALAGKPLTPRRF
jgi:hypothetical protein